MLLRTAAIDFSLNFDVFKITPRSLPLHFDPTLLVFVGYIDKTKSKQQKVFCIILDKTNTELANKNMLRNFTASPSTKGSKFV